MDVEAVIQNETSQKESKYINAYMRNLEKCYRWTYLQGENRDADIENGQVDTVGKERAG